MGTRDRQAAPAGQYLGLEIGSEQYAIGVLRVKEILQFDGITRVPGAPASIRGVINVRGSVVPVVDLALKFGQPETAVTRRACVVLVEVELDGETTVMGVMADSVSEVMDLTAEDIQPPPAFGTRVRVDYLLGMGRADNRFRLILDVDHVLSPGELLAAVEATASEEEAPAADAPQGLGAQAAAP